MSTDTIIPAPTDPLRPSEVLAFSDLRKAIRIRLESLRDDFIGIGEHLTRIRDERLYRAEFGTFEAFVQADFGMSRQRAYQFIQAVAVLADVNTCRQIGADGSPLQPPTTEAQLRALASVPAEDRSTVWADAVLTAQSGQAPTASQVAAAARAHLDPTFLCACGDHCKLSAGFECHACGRSHCANCVSTDNEAVGYICQPCAELRAAARADELSGRVELTTDDVTEPAADSGPREFIVVKPVGDFYEAYYVDAEMLAETLELTLTSRQIDGQRVPMCGFPHHALERYTERAARAGVDLIVDVDAITGDSTPELTTDADGAPDTFNGDAPPAAKPRTAITTTLTAQAPSAPEPLPTVPAHDAPRADGVVAGPAPSAGDNAVEPGHVPTDPARPAALSKRWAGTADAGGEQPNDDFDTDAWETPDEVLDLAREVLGVIDYDPASNHHAQQRVQARRYSCENEDSLRGCWGIAASASRVWLNPPYSFPKIKQFSEKLVAEFDVGNVHSALLLVNDCTDTDWWQALAARFPVCFPNGRVSFVHPTTGQRFQNRRGQSVFYLGPDAQRFAEVFGQLGLVMKAVA